MIKVNKTDPFMQFIEDNKCIRGCIFSAPFIHTHELYPLHDNIVTENCECGKKLKHWVTSYFHQFSTEESGYLSDFRCEYFVCDSCFRILTPSKDSPLPQEESWLKIVHMENEIHGK